MGANDDDRMQSVQGNATTTSTTSPETNSASSHIAGNGIGAARLHKKLLQRKKKDQKNAQEPHHYGGVYERVTANDTPLLSHAGDPKTEIAKLKKDEVVRPVDLGATAEFNQGLVGTGEQWWKVDVRVGDHKDKVGWAQAGGFSSATQVEREGKTEFDANVAGGEVKVSTGQRAANVVGEVGDNQFALEYKGKDATEARWLQFLWREVITVDENDKAEPALETVTTTGAHPYKLTGGGTEETPGHPSVANYTTDSASKSEPFFEAGFNADRTADSTSINDQPGPLVETVKKKFAATTKSVVSRAHFSTFLIKGQKVAFRTNIGVVWKFARKEDVTVSAKGVPTVFGSGAADSLPGPIAERFHEQYPAYRSIK